MDYVIYTFLTGLTGAYIAADYANRKDFNKLIKKGKLCDLKIVTGEVQSASGQSQNLITEITTLAKGTITTKSLLGTTTITREAFFSDLKDIDIHWFPNLFIKTQPSDKTPFKHVKGCVIEYDRTNDRTKEGIYQKIIDSGAKKTALIDKKTGNALYLVNPYNFERRVKKEYYNIDDRKTAIGVIAFGVCAGLMGRSIYVSHRK